ncbi:hypothetical protein AB0J63_00175 [Streptosporangium canum]|uniref:hypothetical protein n=1 Tax=Streptosporangium canum TaxID=324952 RepID=UPI00343A1CA6
MAPRMASLGAIAATGMGFVARRQPPRWATDQAGASTASANAAASRMSRAFARPRKGLRKLRELGV